VALATVLLAAMLIAGLGAIRQRTLGEMPLLGMAAPESTVQARESPIKYRLGLYRFGFEKWQERPLLGWGPGAVKSLIADSQRPELLQPPKTSGEPHPLDHMHNTYLELLVELGLVGALLLFSIAWLLLRGLWNAYRQGVAPREHFLFVAGALALTAVWSLFDFAVVHWHWRYFVILTAAIAYSFHLRAQARG
jgi:O-antigen ligase